jgi:hypothetical protein
MSVLKNLMLLHRPISLFDFGATVSNVTPELINGRGVTWTGSISATPTGAPSGLGSIDLTTQNADLWAQGVGGYPQVTAGNSAFCSEFLIYPTAYPTTPSGDPAGVLQDMGGGIDASMYVAFIGGGTPAIQASSRTSNAAYKSAIFPMAYVGQWLHVVHQRLNSLAGGGELWVNGVLLGTYQHPNLIGTSWGFNKISGVSGYALPCYASILANYNRALTASEIAEHYSAVAGTHKLAGTALLGTSEGASQVLVRRVTDRQHLESVTPHASTGAWEVFVPPGDYEICAVGPAGYQAQVYTPVTAIVA